MQFKAPFINFKTEEEIEDDPSVYVPPHKIFDIMFGSIEPFVEPISILLISIYCIALILVSIWIIKKCNSKILNLQN